MNDLPSSQEIFERARAELGLEKNLLFNAGKPCTGREITGEYTMEVQHDCRCDELEEKIRQWHQQALKPGRSVEGGIFI